MAMRARAVLALLCAIGCAAAPRIAVEPARGPAPWTGLDANDAGPGPALLTAVTEQT